MQDRFETFATTITAIYRCIQKIKDRDMTALGLKGTHVMCLYILGKQPDGLTAAQLCDLCGEDKAAISRTVSELSEKNYIKLEVQPQKRAYRARIRLTEQGKKAIRYINDRINSALEAVGTGLNEAQRSEFYQALTHIADNLKQYI